MLYVEDAELVRSEGSSVAAATYSFSNFVVNVTAEIYDFRLISLDTNRVSRETVCLPSFEL